MRIQIFRPINVQEIARWLQENPRIEVRGFSVAAGADDPAAGLPLSICAILYEPASSASGVAGAALAEAQHLIDQVAESAPPPLAPRPVVPDPDATTGNA